MAYMIAVVVLGVGRKLICFLEAVVDLSRKAIDVNAAS